MKHPIKIVAVLGVAFALLFTGCPDKKQSALEKQIKKTGTELQKLGKEAVKAGKEAVKDIKEAVEDGKDAAKKP